jgi:hypothetical protein
MTDAGAIPKRSALAECPKTKKCKPFPKEDGETFPGTWPGQPGRRQWPVRQELIHSVQLRGKPRPGAFYGQQTDLNNPSTVMLD